MHLYEVKVVVYNSPAERVPYITLTTNVTHTVYAISIDGSDDNASGLPSIPDEEGTSNREKIQKTRGSNVTLSMVCY